MYKSELIEATLLIYNRVHKILGEAHLPGLSQHLMDNPDKPLFLIKTAINRMELRLKFITEAKRKKNELRRLLEYCLSESNQ